VAENTIFIDNKVLNLLFKGTVSNEQANAVQLPVLLQPDGTLRGWDIQVGQDPNGRERPALTDEQRLMRVRPYEPYRSVVALQLTGVFQTLYTCPADSIAKVEVWFGVTAGVGGSIALRVKGRIMYEGVAMRAGGVGPRTRVTLAAAEIIEAYRPTGTTNLTAIASVELYSTGDENTGV